VCATTAQVMCIGLPDHSRFTKCLVPPQQGHNFPNVVPTTLSEIGRAIKSSQSY